MNGRDESAAGLRVTRHADPDAFLAAAAKVTAGNPAAAAFAGAWVQGLRRDPPAPAERGYLATILVDGAAGVAMQRGEGPVIIDGSDARAAVAFAEDLAAEHVGLQGVVGEFDAAAAFADAWKVRTGRAHERRFHLRHHGLTRVEAVPAATGGWRAARADDLDWLIAQMLEFVAEAGVPDTEARVRSVVPRRLAAGRYRIWEDDGERVALAGYTECGADAERIGPVWTPVPRRRRGYATALVAALSRERLAAGTRQLFLVTDVANPTSNAIYARIGYRPLHDIHHFDFVAPADGGAA
jgi:predicted GNAT family acetyltransferase